jgi:DNA-binding NarL/FixJ family response regulator
MSNRILIVDDESKLLRAVAATLSEEGYSVTTAQSGAEALVHLAGRLPDLIISDIRMPGMDGYKLVSTLRSNPRTGFIPIIFLTAKDKLQDRIVGFRNGVDAYVTKPFDPEELLAVITNILDRAARVSTELARLMNISKAGEASVPPMVAEDLTDSEMRIASLVSEGLSNKQIAGKLTVSVRTVEGHIGNILSKKGWNSRVDIVRHILKQSVYDA